MSNFYAVAKGRGKVPNIYNSWDECKKAVNRYSGAIYKKFNNKEEAIAFIESYKNKRKQISEEDIIKTRRNPPKGIITQKEINTKAGIYKKVCKTEYGTVGENIVATYLRYFGIKYKLQQEVFINYHKHLFDFAIFDKNKLIAFIEYDGIQHFEAIEKFGGENGLKLRKERDNEKNLYCILNNIKLVRVPYDKAHKAESIIREEIVPLVNEYTKNNEYDIILNNKSEFSQNTVKKIEKKKQIPEQKQIIKQDLKISCEELSKIINYNVNMNLLSILTKAKNLHNVNRNYKSKTKIHSVKRKEKSFEVQVKNEKYIISK